MNNTTTKTSNHSNNKQKPQRTPTHLLVREEALILKNVQLHMFAIALPRSVLPVPGGPNKRRPGCDDNDCFIN